MRTETKADVVKATIAGVLYLVIWHVVTAWYRVMTHPLTWVLFFLLAFAAGYYVAHH